MNKGIGITLATAAVAVSLSAGYWLGAKGTDGSRENPAAQTEPAKKEPKLLYYRNPMGLPDTSPTPKKDQMGMDYIPVYEGEDDAEPSSPNQIRISTEKIQKLGVRTEAASLRTLDKVVRAVGRITPDERRTFTISPKFEGYVERLYVNVTGQPIAKGQPLFEVYSQELISAQREYAIAVQGGQALKGAGADAQAMMKQLADSSLMRLKNWDISDEQIKALAKSGAEKRTLTFRSPVAGIVTDKKAVQGMRFMPGDPLYQIADLSSVWVLADVFEQDIGLIKTGAQAKVRINAYPDKVFTGTVTYVYPTLTAETRTVPVRVELPNPGILLKPAMFAEVELPVAAKGPVVTVPISAVIDSGTRRIVLTEAGEGRFDPREVKLGARGDNYVEVLEGVKEGERVVTTANFLIDAESNLKAAISGFGQAANGTPPAASTGHKAHGTVAEVDADAGTASISHEPVASLDWPGMTMTFKFANPSLMDGLKPGTAIDFEFVERQPGEWVVTDVKPSAVAKGGGAASDANAHAGH